MHLPTSAPVSLLLPLLRETAVSAVAVLGTSEAAPLALMSYSGLPCWRLFLIPRALATKFLLCIQEFKCPTSSHEPVNHLELW